jgi:hypothetical protein
MKSAALIGLVALVTMCIVNGSLVYTRGNGWDWFFFITGGAFTATTVFNVWLEWGDL